MKNKIHSKPNIVMLDYYVEKFVNLFREAQTDPQFQKDYEQWLKDGQPSILEMRKLAVLRGKATNI